MGDNCLKVAAATTNNLMTDFPLKMKPNDTEHSGTKKLMQARLPFKPLTQKVVKPAGGNPKKRKLNDQDIGPSKFPKFVKTLTENKSKLNTSHDNSDMEVCDEEIISSSESGNPSLSAQRTVKSHTLDKFFAPKNVQDEIISSSTNDYVDLTKSDSEEDAQGKDKGEESSEKEKENKLSDTFNKDANFTCTLENKVKTNSNPNPSPVLSNKLLKEKYARTASPENKLMAEVRVVLQDVAFCDIPGCSTPKSFKKYFNNNNNSSTFTKSIELTSPIKVKDDNSSELDNSVLCVTVDDELRETLSTSISSINSEVGISTQSPHASEPSGTSQTDRVKSKVSSERKGQRDAIRHKVKEERERDRLERKHEKESERLEKLEQRKKEKEMKEHEKNQQKELREKERLEKKEILDKERLEKEKVKEDQRRKKQEIIEAKQEEKRKKDEEKKLKEEEKLKEEGEKLRKQARTKAAFQNFFFQKPKDVTSVKPKEHSGLFMPFEVKNDMRMAPSCRRTTVTELTEKLDTSLSQQKQETLYLDELRTGIFTRRKSVRTWPKEEEPDDVSHEEDVVKKVTYRVKLLQFHTNYRPPYYGTWRKKSSVLTPKFPWKQDTKLFDYEIDSDDEWEEEEPGESISCSEGEEEKEEKEEEEDEEDGWMVPHGYLSEGEGCEEDEEVTPEMLKARQAAKVESWERQRKQQCLPHRAEHIGCAWEGDQLEAFILSKLSEFKVCVIDGEFPITTSFNGVPKDLEHTETRSANHLKKRSVPEEAMPDLIKFIHGNRAGIKKLVIEFQLIWNSKTSDAANKASQGENTKSELNVESTPGTPAEKTDSTKQPSTPNTSTNEPDAPEENFSISKRQLDKKITAIAVRAKRPDFPKICWYVHQEVLKQYGLENHPLREKVAEGKPAEENPSGASVPSKICTTPNQANVVEPKTPVSKTSEKVNKTPSRDQMSILSFAQAADKINANKTDGDCEILDIKTLDMKSPTNKPRDQMSILSFTRAPAAEKDSTVVSVQSSNDDNKVNHEIKEVNTTVEPAVNNTTESGHSMGSTAKIHDICMEDDTKNMADKNCLLVENDCKTELEKDASTNLQHSPDGIKMASLETDPPGKLPQTKSVSVADTPVNNNIPPNPDQNSAMAVSEMSAITESANSKENKIVTDKSEP